MNFSGLIFGAITSISLECKNILLMLYQIIKDIAHAYYVFVVIVKKSNFA